MAIITFKNGAIFQVEVPGSQHIDSQKKAIERMKDTLKQPFCPNMYYCKYDVFIPHP
ncbi:cholera enterotoxin subunit B [Vibrio cholerae]|nr:cholera enterotoxin subunit B [Vibrio cholerae]